MTKLTIPADPTAAWLALLPYAEPGDVREWLGERVSVVAQNGVRDLACRDSWPAVAAALAELRGHPNGVITGSALH